MRRALPSLLLLTVTTALGCSRGGAPLDTDLGPAGLDLTSAADSERPAPDLAQAADLSRDLATGPTAEQCLEGWRTYGGACPAPEISASYVGNGCVGTTGWFLDGKNFQLEMHNMGIADYGPQSFGANGNQKHWNIITPTRLCVTVSAAAKAAWVGHTIYVKNPDGKQSNSVLVEDRL